jgi:hypothetical protein
MKINHKATTIMNSRLLCTLLMSFLLCSIILFLTKIPRRVYAQNAVNINIVTSPVLVPGGVGVGGVSAVSAVSEVSSNEDEIHVMLPTAQEIKKTLVHFTLDVEAYLNQVGLTLDDVCAYQYNQRKLFPLDKETETTTSALEEEEEEEHSKNKIKNIIFAFTCVTFAALAAGLTMGLLSQDLLDLKIKELASSNLKEREQAATLVPLIKDHHRLVRIIFDDWFVAILEFWVYTMLPLITIFFPSFIISL